MEMKQQTAYIAVSWLYIFLCLCLVLNRIYVRAVRRSDPLTFRVGNWSDALVCLAWMFNVFQSVCDTVLYAKGCMVKYTDLDMTQPRSIEIVETFIRIYYVENAIYYVPLYCVKGAILLFLLEVTPPVLRHVRRAIWVGLGFSAVGVTYTVLIYIFGCKPITEWADLLTGGSCRAALIGQLAALCYHMFTDLYIYAIPFFLIHHLRIISRSQRLATAAMFSAGFILVCFPIPQLASAWIPGLENPLMWAFWVCLHEQAFAVVVACLPALRVTMQRRGGMAVRKRRDKRISMARRISRGELVTREVAQVNTEEQSDLSRKGSDLEMAEGASIETVGAGCEASPEAR